MVIFRIAVAAALTVGLPATVVAQTPAAGGQPVLRTGSMLRTADGRQVGQIEHVEQGSDSAVSVIYAGRFVHIPVSTISVSDKGAVTSLTLADVRKLN